MQDYPLLVKTVLDHAALNHAAEYAKKGKGPVLIEAMTYRKGAHTTSDDPTKYRTKEEEDSWEVKDPLKRLKAYLVNTKKLKITKKEEEKIISQYKKEIDRHFVEAENYPAYPLDDVFQYMYEDMPADLIAQKMEHEKFLKWKEER